MKVKKRDNNDTIIIEEGNKSLRIFYGGNGDLYWVINDKDYNDKEPYDFVITKENFNLYNLFDKLYNDIETINIYDNDDEEPYVPFDFESDEEKNEYLLKLKKEKEEEKELCRLFNHSNYNSLFNEDNKEITWYSDETSYKVSNILKIKKEDESYRLTFSEQEYIEGYDEDFHSLGNIPIRFRNSGSRYNPFNIIFMRMYNNLKEIDDVNDIGHQIDIEEYLYNVNHKSKVLKLNRKVS